MTDSTVGSFNDLALPSYLLDTLQEVGYEQPFPIQLQSIPPLLEGRDLLGVAQTGTGKTAAFALPLLAHLDLNARVPQVLVLTPTRELAIQVAEAFQRYASKMKDFHVLPIYGGQEYRIQLRALKRGLHVVVGTPGRVMDHLKRGSLVLDELKTLVLDEADEMLRMGFIDDVTWIMDHTPDTRQVALFSATMPPAIRNVADNYLKSPVEVKIKAATKTVERLEQYYWLVQGTNKLDALTRILESEPFDAIMIFVRTKNSTTELAEKLEARGFASAAINGDMNQAMRERVINRFKDGQLDIIVATDVAARGIDVPRVSHVINYDIPYDNESYVHRVGRTGRAGRDGKAIMFVAPRERRLLRSIEKSIGQSISSIKLPSRAELTDIRISNFKDLIQETIESENLDFYRSLANDIISDELPADALQAALLYLAQKERPLLPSKADQKHERSPDQGDDPTIQKSGSKRETYDDGIARETYKISVGHNQGVLPKDIVGAIANEAEIDSKYIGRIQIFHEYSTVDLPEGMPPEILKSLQGIWIRSTKIKMLLYKHGQDPQENPKERSKKSKTPRSKHATQQSAPTSGKARKKKQGPSGKPGKGRKRY